MGKVVVEQIVMVKMQDVDPENRGDTGPSIFTDVNPTLPSNIPRSRLRGEPLFLWA